MLTARSIFASGDTVTDIIAAVVTREPDWNALPASTPPHIRRLLDKATFARYEEFNTGASYAAQAAGFATPALPTEHVWTVGANYYLNPNVVFKIDYQDFNHDDTALGYGNRFDLGIGYQF